MSRRTPPDPWASERSERWPNLDPELAAVEAWLPVPGEAGERANVAARRDQHAGRVRGALGDVDHTGLHVQDLEAPGCDGSPSVPVRTYRPEGAEGRLPVVLWMHGGGFCLGSALEGDTGGAVFAQRLEVMVVDVEYRLAPEHPAPAALEDCWAALCWVHEQSEELAIDPARVLVGGGSAGACLAAGLAQRARDAGGPPICFQLLSVPVLDDRRQTKSSRSMRGTPVIDADLVEQMWRWYLGEAHEGEPPRHVAPGRMEDLEGLPPAYVAVTELDPLRDEGVRYAQRLLDAGVSVELHAFPGTFHASEAVTSASVSQRQLAERVDAAQRGLRAVRRSSPAGRAQAGA